MEERGRELVEIPADGLCFLRALQHCLAVQHSESYSLKEIKIKIFEEITRKTKHYMAFHTAKTPQQMLQQVLEYLDKKIFATDIVDVVIGLCCNIFTVTLWIFQESESGKLESISYSTDQQDQKRRHVHLALYRDRRDVDGFGSHYNAVVSKKKNKGQLYMDISSGPPSPGEISTPVPSPSDEQNEFNPTLDVSEILPDFSSEPDASMYNLSTPDQRVLFPLETFAGIEKEPVLKVPYNINGNHSYSIDIQRGKWHKAQEDGRWFLMHTSTVRRSNTVRKSGKCLGSYICNNNNCPKYTSGKGRNTYAFTNIGLDLYECKTCGNVADRQFCGALKLTLFYPDRNVLEVFYAGTHTCSLKSRSAYNLIPQKMKKAVLKPILQKNPRATTKQISEEAAEHFLRLGKPDMAIQSIRLAQDRKLVAEMKQRVITRVTDQDPNSFAAVAELRKQLKSFDPYLIYKLNDGTLNDDISFVFKSSRCAAELALEMDYEDPENRSCLKEEPVYCDTMHSRVEHYKNITAWVKNPITRAVMRIATMEAKNEDTPTMTLFFNLLNEVLQKVSGKPKYKFNPSRFYVDEAGANKNAIAKVFGHDAVNRTVTCQWHFLQCARAKAMNVQERHRKTFLKLCKRWIRAATRSEYDSISAALRTLCERSEILPWFLWWEERKFHIVPAFRGFNLSGLNLAESGQSGMKPKTRKKLRLIDAAYKDCSQMMRQDEMYKAYIGNISKEIGKGLNIRQIQERDRRAQEDRARRYADALLRGDVNAQTDDEENTEGYRVFIPTDSARHRAPRYHSKKNLTEKRKKGTLSQEEAYISDASSIHSDEQEEVPQFVDDDFVSSVRATKLVFINNTIKRCYGCGQEFNHQQMVSPGNLVFSKKTRRMRPDGKGGQVKNKIATNAFFCARDMACMELEFPKVQKKHIYMGNLTFRNITPAHKKFLKLKGYWDAIIANRKLKAVYQ